MAEHDSDLPELESDDQPDCDEEDDDDGWGDVADEESEEQMNMLIGDVKCLFCQCVEPSVDRILTHFINIHDFNLLNHCRSSHLDCIGFIQMINFIRKQNSTPDDVLKNLSCLKPDWSSDEFMAPVDPNDLLLQLDIEWAQLHHPSVSLMSQKSEEQNETNLRDTFSQSEAIQALIDRVQTAERDRDFLKDELDRALIDMEKLRLTGQSLVSGSGDSKEDKSHICNNSSLAEEDGYFASYGHHDIHMTMLKDRVRTESYRDFMLNNSHLFEGKTVLDVGCGTGILSMFAVKAGASHVVAVDQSNIIYQAMDIARENNVHEKITFVKGRLEDVVLPILKFDIIISEWMGYFLLFEAMLDSVLWARDRFLTVDGCVYPDNFSMLVAGVSDSELRRSKVDFWDDVYGFKMSCMKPEVVDEVHVRLVKRDTLITQPAVIKTIDVMRCQVEDLDFSSQFALTCTADADMTALVGYFTTTFDTGCTNKVHFSTGPEAPPTHWEQSVMMFAKPIAVKKDSQLTCHMTYRKHPQDSRGIIINLSIQGQKMKFNLS
ncbi:protein arginine N-methyltransferase 1 [Biomphalaria glabrata]|nr:protein arginine N-methyltransferase 1-like [Biomphalaria glabrata]